MQNNVLFGITLMVITTFMFSSMDGVSRYLAEKNNVFTLVTMRYWFIAFVMMVTCLFIKNRVSDILNTKQPYIQFSRGVILSLNNCLVVYTFTLLGLVETHAIIACYPLIVAGLSVPFLGERFGWRRWMGNFYRFHRRNNNFKTKYKCNYRRFYLCNNWSYNVCCLSYFN